MSGNEFCRGFAVFARRFNLRKTVKTDGETVWRPQVG